MKANKDLYPIYRRSFFQAAQEAQANEGHRYLFKKAIFNGIKMFCNMPDSQSYEEDYHNFHLSEAIKNCVGFLTPNEFMNMFPIEKEFDGHKYEVKDYYHTMNYIDTLDHNKAIKEQVDPIEFLWEYHNWDIHHFDVEVIGCLSNLRQAEGKLELFEEFMASQGMDTDNTFKASNGQVMYVRHGKPEAIKSIQSKQLKLVK